MTDTESSDSSVNISFGIQPSFIENHLRKIVFLLFFFSGIAGLVYEIVWTRALVLVFGSTSFAISTVLGSYMAGLALGGFLFGRWIDRRYDQLRIYGFLIIGTGVYAILLPLLLKAVSPLYTLVYRAFGVNFTILSIFRFLISSVLLIIPTTMMGGTLPTLCKFLTRHRDTVRINLGRLYALNTFGAVFGCFISAFLFLPYLGMLRTTLTAALIDILAGIVAMLLYRETIAGEPSQIHRAEDENLEKVASAQSVPAWFLKIILILFAFSGFASLAYEVLWTRLLVFFISNNIYAFSIMLTVFLLGIGFGGYIFERFFRKARNLWGIFVLIEILIGAGGLLSIPILIHLREVVINFSAVTPFWNATLNTGLKALIVMGFPTMLIGIAFPLVNTIYISNSEKIGSRIGSAYSINNIGSIFGSIAAGFVIVPFLGTRLGLITVASVNIAVGLAAFTALCFWRQRHTYTALLISIITIIMLPQISVKLISKKSYAEIFRTEKDSMLTYVKEGIGGTVTIEEFANYRTISINGVNVAGTSRAFHTTQKLQAHLALLLHPNPEEVMQIGFGSGGTAYSASLHNVKQIDCVEISPVILEAAPNFFETNKGILSNPKVNVFVDDARSYMLHTDKKYDVILSDSTHPIVAGNGALYTVDYFRQCYNRLNEWGVFSTWLPLYDLRSVDYKIILNSLCEVFPYVYLWHTSIERNEWTIVHGFKQPLIIDYAQLEKRMSEQPIQKDLAQIYIKTPVDVLSLFLMAKEPMQIYLTGIKTKNTDDNAYIEFLPARYAVKGTRPILFREAFAELVHFRTPVFPITILTGERRNQLFDDLRNDYNSMTAVIRGRLYEMWGDINIAEQQFQYAIRLFPGNYVAKDLLGILAENKKTILAGIKLNPDNPQSRVDLAHYYFFHGEYEKAWEEYELAIAMEPSNQYAYSQNTLCAIFLGDYDAAIETTVRWKKNVCVPGTSNAITAYRNLIYNKREMKYRPDDIELMAEIAGQYANITCFTNSKKYIAKGSNIAPNNISLLSTRLFIQRILYDPALVQTSQELLEIDPANELAKSTLELIKSEPSNPYVFFDARRNELDEGKKQSAEIPANQKDAYRLYQNGMQAWNDEKCPEAISYLTQALNKAPEKKEICLNIAEISLFTEEYNNGISAVEKCLTFFPDDEELKAALSKLKFHQELPENPRAEDYFKGAMIYLMHGEYEEGLPYLLSALEMNPEIENGLLNLGSYYMSTGQLDKAKEAYDKALDKAPDNENLKKIMAILDEKMGKDKKDSPGREPTGAE